MCSGFMVELVFVSMAIRFRLLCGSNKCIGIIPTPKHLNILINSAHSHRRNRHHSLPKSKYRNISLHGVQKPVSSRAGLSSRPAGKLPGAPTYKRRYDVSGIIGYMELVKSRVHTWKKKILRKLSSIKAQALTVVCQPSSKRKHYKE
jgi:hypothetical protein